MAHDSYNAGRVASPAVAHAGNRAPEQTPREARKTGFNAFFSSLLTKHSVSHDALGAFVGVSRQKVGRWVDIKGDETPIVADIEVMPRELAIDVVASLAEKIGKVLVDAALASSSLADDLRSLHDVLRTCSEVTAQYSAALADGRMDVQEAERIERACDAAISLLTNLRERARAAVRAYGEPIRKGESVR